MSRRHLISSALLVSAVSAVPAYAQSVQLPTAQSMASDFPACVKKVSDADQDQAKQKFIAARQDAEEANYDSAIKRFKAAYDLDCSKPELLLIVSQTYEKKGDFASKQAALAALEVYVQRAPKDAPDMGTTLTKIENMKKQLQSAPPPSASSSGQKEEPKSEHSIVPWILVGVGAVAVVGGVVAIATTPDLPDDCDLEKETCLTGPNQADHQSQAGRHVWQPRWGIVAIVGGGVAMVGGVVWHFLEPIGGKSTTGKLRQFTPTIAPGFGGLSYGGTF